MTKTRLIFSKGALLLHYPGQINRQAVVMDIEVNGDVNVFPNPEIGNAVPARVFHGLARRITLPNISNQHDAKEFYNENKPAILRLVAGMDKEWNGSNFVGTLTQDAFMALDELQYAAGGGL